MPNDAAPSGRQRPRPLELKSIIDLSSWVLSFKFQKFSARGITLPRICPSVKAPRIQSVGGIRIPLSAISFFSFFLPRGVRRRGRWRKARPGRPAARAAGLRAGGGPAAPLQTPQFAKSHETGSTPSVVLCLSKTGPITASGGSSAFICTDVTPPQQGAGPDCARQPARVQARSARRGMRRRQSGRRTTGT
eukprot:COSAG06_NODE_79_length_25437_cov_12.062673_3_plen_191_part_00